MKPLPVLNLLLACIWLASCGKSQKSAGTPETGTTSPERAAPGNNEALESLKLIQEREERDRVLTEKIRKSPPK